MEEARVVGFLLNNKLMEECIVGCLNSNHGGKYKGVKIKLHGSSQLEPLDYVLIEMEKNIDFLFAKNLMAEVSEKTNARIIAFGSSDAIELLAWCVKCGAWSFFLSDGPPGFEGFLEFLDFAEKGYCQREVLEAVVEIQINSSATISRLGTLTMRERKVAQLMSEGLANKQISRELNISIYTIKNHLHSIFKKLGVANRLSAGQIFQSFSK